MNQNQKGSTEAQPSFLSEVFDLELYMNYMNLNNNVDFSKSDKTMITSQVDFQA